MAAGGNAFRLYCWSFIFRNETTRGNETRQKSLGKFICTSIEVDFVYFEIPLHYAAEIEAKFRQIAEISVGKNNKYIKNIYWKKVY